MPKKKISIDDLAVMINRGFEAVDKRFDELDERFKAVDSRLDAVEKRLGLVETGQEDVKLRISEVAYRFELNQLEKRMEVLEQKVGVSAGDDGKISYERI